MEKARQDRSKGVLASFLALLYAKDHVNVRNLRWRRLPYMLIFPLAPVFANMQGAWFSAPARLFGLDAMTLLGSAYCLGAGALFAFASMGTAARLARLCALSTAAAFAAWLLMGESPASLPTAIAFMFGLGGCAACAAFAFTFALNNAERFLGAMMISLFFSLSQMDSGLSLVSGLFGRAYLTALVAGGCACLCLYRANDFAAGESRPPARMNPALWLTLYFFIAHYFVEIFYTYLPGSSLPGAMLANGAMGVLVIFLAFALQLTTRSSVYNMCNLFFVAMICTYALHFMPEGSLLRGAARFLHGFEQMGYLAAYYLLGCVFKKHADPRLFKLCLVTVLPASMLSYVIPGLLSAQAPGQLPLAATLTSGLVFIGFVLLSPAYSKHLFFAEWSDDFIRADMRGAVQAAESAGGAESLGLSARERQVAALLLRGLSGKQIAGELGITVNTVNFHIKNLYKKLGIRSRSELFARLGPSAPPEGQRPAGL